MDINHILNLILKATSVYILVLFLTRSLGRKQLSQVSFFNYITGATISSIVAIGITAENNLIDNGIITIWWCILIYITDYISLKSSSVRKAIEGEPVIIIKNGEVENKVLDRTRLNINDLMMLLRAKDIFNINEVKYAILEVNGELTVFKKEHDQQVTKKDLNKPNKKITE